MTLVPNIFATTFIVNKPIFVTPCICAGVDYSVSVFSFCFHFFYLFEYNVVVGELGNPSGFTRLSTGSLLTNRPDSHLELLQDTFTVRGLFYPSPFLSGNHSCMVKCGCIRPVPSMHWRGPYIIEVVLFDAITTPTHTHVKCIYSFLVAYDMPTNHVSKLF